MLSARCFFFAAGTVVAPSGWIDLRCAMKCLLQSCQGACFLQIEVSIGGWPDHVFLNVATRYFVIVDQEANPEACARPYDPQLPTSVQLITAHAVSEVRLAPVPFFTSTRFSARLCRERSTSSPVKFPSILTLFTIAQSASPMRTPFSRVFRTVRLESVAPYLARELCRVACTGRASGVALIEKQFLDS